MENNSEKISFDYIATAGKLLPILIALSAILFAAGTLGAWIADSKLGVGELIVSKERALSIGIILSLFILPTIVLSMSIKELGNSNTFKSILSEIGFIFVYLGCVGLLVAVVIHLFMLSLLPDAEASKVSKNWFFVSTLIPFSVALLVILRPGSKKKESIRISGISMALLSLFVTFSSAMIPLLPGVVGGHRGADITITFDSGQKVSARIVASDSNMIVLLSNGKHTAYARKNIIRIDSSIKGN